MELFHFDFHRKFPIGKWSKLKAWMLKFEPIQKLAEILSVEELIENYDSIILAIGMAQVPDLGIKVKN